MINYDARWFSPAGGPADEKGRIAVYRQRGDLLWGEFAGGDARRGALTGRVDQNGHLEFGYCLVLVGGAVISGRCRSVPEVLPDGRIRLHETWERFGADAATGTSCIEEIPAAAQTTREIR